jgi:hypothetical protein
MTSFCLASFMVEVNGSSGMRVIMRVVAALLQLLHALLQAHYPSRHAGLLVEGVPQPGVEWL